MFYDVTLSARVARAVAAGRGQEARDALKQISHILTTYPQYGEPLMDLPAVKQTIYVLSVGPLSVTYAIDEERRLVIIGVPFKPMPNCGFE
jgi:hypothetical protein